MAPTVQETASAALQAYTRIKPYINKTPLLPSRTTTKPATAEGTQTTLLFKTENFQRTGSFKIRGAMAKLSATGGATSAPETTTTTTNENDTTRSDKNDEVQSGRKERGTITASSGNHGIGAACAASTLGKHLTVVLPENVVQAKLEKIKAYGVEVILHGSETGLAETHAQSLASSGEYTYISPYNDPDVIAGQGTVGVEILEQCRDAGGNGIVGGRVVDNVFVAMGGGGLISGIGSVMRVLSPSTKVYGVSAVNSKALAASMEAGGVVEVEHRKTLADAVAGGIDGDSITVPLAREVVDVVVECEEEDIREAIRELAFQEGMLVEGAAALAFAGFRNVMNETGVKGKASVVVLCGGNFDAEVIKSVLV
ncbi:tryptophan synthase beta subunit-like PLP-dependent enzyme [Aspergillus carlsbadensis]|nr:tryptophan synthase beta subunit-like PLP-dependent enzyme [Aspergillus carlsbadensis]